MSTTSLSIGIVGLPNVGKSTLFNALLKRQAALAANYPFATIEPNIGVVDVPDSRLNKLADLVKSEFTPRGSTREIPEKVIPAVIKFYDIAGLVEGASKGEGLGNQFLSHIRETDALVQVVRGFEDSNVIRAGSKDPAYDVTVINTELIMSDLDTLSKRLSRLENDSKRQRTPELLNIIEVLKRIEIGMNSGMLAGDCLTSSEERELVKDLNLLTAKPMIYAVNVSESELSSSDKEITQKYENIIRGALKGTKDPRVVRISAKIESELCSLSENDAQLFMKDLGISESGLDVIIKEGFSLLGLQTYLTAGPKEVRAWTIRKGWKAPQAAGVIHTDFERGFISAEIISFDHLVSCGGWKSAKEKGLVRIEGKEYIMQDGDIVEFRFSV